MTKDEIIEELDKRGIITQIGGDYMITEKYKTMLSQPKVSNPIVPQRTKLDYDQLLDVSTNGSNWPADILDSVGRNRVTALMDACGIKSHCERGDYRLRGVNKEAVNIIGNIIDSGDVDATTFIEAITLYYKFTERPKSFKNLLLEGDALDIYSEHIEGTLKGNLTKDGEAKDTQRWN